AAGWGADEAAGAPPPAALPLLGAAALMPPASAALLFVLLAGCFPRPPPKSRPTFGWVRLTTLAAVLNAIALGVITMLVVWVAIQRFPQPQPGAGVAVMVIAVAG
ncbi:cation transporter, partial [Klebsiella pneumoniae]|uniref:cation transporter n=1 Tax=Klebsiella pneumoniae TaxID=573 RepID=UPI002731FDB1